MTATLWIDTDSDKTIELGGTLQAYSSFSEMAHLVGPNYLKDYPELFSVMTAVEDQNDVPKDWLEEVRVQASEFLTRYRSKLSSNAIGILEQLSENDASEEDNEEGEATENAWSEEARRRAIEARRAKSSGKSRYIWRRGHTGDLETVVEGVHIVLANLTSEVGRRHWNIGVMRNGRVDWVEAASTRAEAEDYIPSIVTAEKEQSQGTHNISSSENDAMDEVITTNDEGQWITIGGHPEGDKRHVGGTRVFIKDGRIQWGNVPKSMIGTAVKDFQENIRSHRKVHEARGMTPGEKLTEKEWERHLERHDQKKHLGKTREHVRVAHHEVVRQALEEGKDVPRHVVKEVLRQYGRDLPSAIKPEVEEQHALEETKRKQRRQELERIQKEREQHESEQKRATGKPGSSRPSREEAPSISGRLETETPRPHIPGASEVRGSDHQPVSETSPSHVLSPREAAKLEDVNKRLNRYEQHFRSRGNHKLADWMGLLREHINTVGVQHALDSLDPEVEGGGEKVQYGGHFLEGHHEAEFIEKYLDRAGISLITGSQPEGERRAISSASESPYEGGLHGRGRESDFFPALQTLRDKLHEAQHLPGLEKSEDLSKLMGGEFGAKVERFTPEVVKKLDETYGEGQWIVKSYGDEAYAGYGIYFPQRAAQVQRDAQNNMWASGMHLAKYGFSHLRDADGKVVGIKHHNGDEYHFGKVEWDLDEDYRPYIKIEGTPKYNNTIHGEARHWADVAARASLDEQGASFPPGKFMSQPAFPVVGITNEERAQGVTFKKGQEGRVHIVTRNGNVSVVPAATWLKNEPLPVVFGNEHTRAMEKAALEAIQQLPLSERSGQIYAPDCVPVKGGGYKVVEANPANMAGGSGYLADNPLVMDAFVAHMVHRQPMHVAFIRRLLTSRRR